MIALRLLLLILLTVTAAGCAAIGGIFKAGFWAGIIVVVLVVGLIGVVVAKMR
jgi:hypothetical protein